ncbi:hypothetical protein LRAMOSA02382 [Lichtheimia ramosa]|uniref:Uncharacterized protein n=1 Tax=Lichtheimia ramosa TaxID=688394 RepID=A0A077WQN7_9FUNG|nr:hypothetical protein LRAMOSA02382 [Lichtheimia ramosa]
MSSHRQERKHKRTKHEPISQDDYFVKSAEFRMWLKEEKDRYFNDLDAEKARHYFKKFVKAWNRDELEEKYYRGINSAQLSSTDNTGYKWSFAKKLDQHELDTVRDSVDTMTGGGRSSSQRRRTPAGPSRPPMTGYDQVDEEEREERERAERRAERKAEAKRKRDRREEYLDEVAPKETGREAQMAKKRALNAYHKREKSPDVELDESDIYGGGDDFKAALAAEKRREERRKQRYEERREQRFGPVREKMAEYKAKESATIEMFKQMAEEQRRRGAY